MQTSTSLRLCTVSLCVALFTIAFSPLATAQLSRVADPNWSTPRTADGHPDFQGMWGNKTLTPMERPEGIGAFLSDEQIANTNQEYIVAEAARELSRTHVDAHLRLREVELRQRHGDGLCDAHKEGLDVRVMADKNQMKKRGGTRALALGALTGQPLL